MNVWRALWHDEAGMVLSAEAVLVGTLAVAGAGVGLATAGQSLNEELKELAYSFRSLNQSYSLPGQRGCRAWTAGSTYQQPPVEDSLKELEESHLDPETVH
jgi:hypothetical protein